MFLADSHCLTLTTYPDDPFQHFDAAWNIDRFYNAGGRIQAMAICTRENYSGDSALRYAVTNLGNYYRQMPRKASTMLKAADYDDSKVNIILALEGASPIINNIENLHAFYHLGVRMISLTWNHRNYLADGIENRGGLTAFGREVVAEMEHLGIIIDVSHLNDDGFDDLASIAGRPFLASHSNSRSVFDHPRNLCDEQILEIRRRGGFIGLNFCEDLLGNNHSPAINHFLHHVEHLLELGAVDIIGFGGDLDGVRPNILSNCEYYSDFRKSLERDMLLDNKVIEKIMFRNFHDFTM
ncbi:MAG: dipeptidase, partial [Bacteroidota bacterium]